MFKKLLSFIFTDEINYKNIYDSVLIELLSKTNHTYSSKEYYKQLYHYVLLELNVFNNNLIKDKIKTFTNNISKSKENNNKIPLITDLFNYLCENTLFLNNHTDLKKIFKHKCIDLAIDSNFYLDNHYSFLYNKDLNHSVKKKYLKKNINSLEEIILQKNYKIEYITKYISDNHLSIPENTINDLILLDTSCHSFLI